MGFLVGKAVFLGSGRRGGPGYQALAVGLTYLGIGVAYLPIIATQLKNRPDKDRPAASQAAPAPAPRDSAIAGDSGARAAAPIEAKRASLPRALVAVALLTLSIPVLSVTAGLPGSLISLLIYGFALYEAWKFTRAVRIAFAGPFRVGFAPSAP